MRPHITDRKVFKAQFKKSGKQVALKKVVLKEEEKGKDKHRDGVWFLCLVYLEKRS